MIWTAPRKAGNWFPVSLPPDISGLSAEAANPGDIRRRIDEGEHQRRPADQPRFRPGTPPARRNHGANHRRWNRLQYGFRRHVLRPADRRRILPAGSAGAVQPAAGVPDRIKRPFFKSGGIEIQSRALFNPNLESRNFYVPGIIALLIMLVTLILTCMAIVREREIGTMEQIIVSPIRPVELILGKTIPFAIDRLHRMSPWSPIVGVFRFEVPIRGSLPLLSLRTTLYLLSSLGIGLFISTISRTQQQAMMTMFFFFVPAILLSGFIFPIANMPEIVQYLTYLNPLRYFLVIIRGIFLKGNGFEILWPQMLALAILGSAVFTFSSLRFRKRLE